MRYLTSFAVVLGFSVAILNCSKGPKGAGEEKFNDKRVVLQVAEDKLTLGELQKRFETTEFRDAAHEFEVKRGYVEQFLERFLLIEGAKKAGFVAELDSAYFKRELFKELYELEIMSKVEIGEKEIKEFFKKYGGEIQAGHILVRDSVLAESLYIVLMGGGDFEKLALQFSADERSAKKGGSLGYVPYGRFDDDFQEAAFGLEIGAIARPVRSGAGWHIIKLFDRIKISDEDLQQNKVKYSGQAHKFQEKILLNKFIDYARETYHFEVVEAAVNMLLAKADSIKALGIKPSDLPSSGYLDPSLFSTEEMQILLVKTDSGGSTIGDFLGMLRQYSPEKAPEIRDQKMLERILEGLAMPRILELMALERGLDKTDSFKGEMAYLEGTYLMQKMRDKVQGDIGEISESAIANYYDEHRDEFYFPDQVRVSGIAVKTREEAEELLQRARSGAIFNLLAKKYSLDKKTGSMGGDLNFFTVARYTPIYKAAEGLENGELGGPVELDGNWWIFRVTERMNKKPKELHLVSADISSKISQDRRAQAYSEWIVKMKETTPYQMNFDLVKENLKMGKLSSVDDKKG